MNDLFKKNNAPLTSKEVKAPLPTSTGKLEYTDGTDWFALASESFVLNSLNRINACNVATAAFLDATYDNAQSGVSATLTSNVNETLSVDGISPALSDRVLVKDQTNPYENGVYTVSDVGSGSTPWILTRTTDFDSATQMVKGSVLYVLGGATEAVSSWMLTSAVATVGTSAITFVRLSKSGINTVEGTAGQILVTISDDKATIGFVANAVFPGNEAVTLPVGTDAQRPSTPTAGMIRFTTTV